MEKLLHPDWEYFLRKAGEPVRSTKVKSEEKSQKKALVTPYVPKVKRRNLFSPTN